MMPSTSDDHMWFDAAKETDPFSSNFGNLTTFDEKSQITCLAYVRCISGCDWPVGFPYSEVFSHAYRCDHHS